ncbi:MAG: OmpA family protein [Deltaproteobacteria bacterium]|nr:OmpA family protein [Deltaproteobacteria bacterium]
MRSAGPIALIIGIAAAGCGGTVALNETTPVQIRGERPPPPPPPPEPPPRVEVEETRIRVDEKIHFAFDEATIEHDSDSLLQEIAQVMTDNPQLVKIKIEGHTDSQGSTAYNQDLSTRRANAVMERLVENGVAAERLEAVGHGESRPLDTSETEEAHARNRRVEFNIVETDDSLRPSADAAGEGDDADVEETADAEEGEGE